MGATEKSRVAINRIKKDTEKGVLVSLPEITNDGDVEVWFPKAQVQFEDGNKVMRAPDWLLEAKEKETGVQFTNA